MVGIMKKEERRRRISIVLVTSGFAFILLIVVLAKTIGDGPLVPCIFLLGWLIFAVFIAKYFTIYLGREK